VAPDSAHDIGEPVRGVVREDALAAVRYGASQELRHRHAFDLGGAPHSRFGLIIQADATHHESVSHTACGVIQGRPTSIPTAIDLIYGQLYDRLLFRLGDESTPLEQLRALVCKVALHNSARRI
jgi:hypothetical protein